MTRYLRPAFVAVTLVFALDASTRPHLQAQSPSSLTGGAALQAAYDAILDARFDEMANVVAETCPPAPTEACRVIDALSVWWQIQLDPLSVARDRLFQTQRVSYRDGGLTDFEAVGIPERCLRQATRVDTYYRQVDVWVGIDNGARQGFGRFQAYPNAFVALG